MNIFGFYLIIRPVNSIVSGLAAAIGYLIATGTVAAPIIFLLIAIVTLITAAGNVINDYFDTGIDAINRPERPIPSGIVSPVSARLFAAILFLAGLFLCIFTNPVCFLIAIINSVLLIWYAAKLKSTPFIGNIAISYLSACIFLFGGAYAGIGGLINNLPLALITFLAMVARELLKDAEDMEGDSAGGARTLPMQIGIKKTSLVALVFTILATGASLIPVLWWGVWYLAGIGVIDIFILMAVFRSLSCTTPVCVKGSRAATLLKAGMFLSLIVFTLAALLL
jgi:geranylgeranylglycerol-phosphate geranylgeranyltransferase